eukprot:TRINITY_DN27220_c0_g1_i3.p1 TRINITY_DN27220_c0_g1~~TRINITY_DN27220_c0_g1_i3.p1  ORF type:complete len:363 (+),score=72.74 TRINITY_DN27220_c0_g1_i3:56-1144(+)
MRDSGAPTDLLRLAFRYTLCQYFGPMMLAENDLQMLMLLAGPVARIPPETLPTILKLGRAAAVASHAPAAANSEVLRKRAKELVGVIARRMYNALGLPGGQGCLIVPSASFFNHHCSPNCKVSVSTSGRVTIRTTQEVVAGAELFISYIDTTQPAHIRAATLKQSMHFECRCSRCLDEAGQHLEEHLEAAPSEQQQDLVVERDLYYPDPVEAKMMAGMRARRLEEGRPAEEPYPEWEGVEVRASSVEGAGKGLFASRSWDKGDLLGYYYGNVLCSAQAAQMACDDKRYLLRAGPNVYIDAADSDCVARYMNDPRGSALVANVAFDKQPSRQRAGVYCIKQITKGDEVLVSYGAGYWRGMDLQ